jgi:hypothetical protein
VVLVLEPVEAEAGFPFDLRSEDSGFKAGSRTVEVLWATQQCVVECSCSSQTRERFLPARKLLFVIFVMFAFRVKSEVTLHKANTI